MAKVGMEAVEAVEEAGVGPLLEEEASLIAMLKDWCVMWLRDEGVVLRYMLEVIQVEDERSFRGGFYGR
jgi:hypothetical protein